MGQPAYYAAYSGAAPPRSGANHASIAPYGPFAAGDGGTITLAIQNAREWTRFCAEVLGDAALAEDERFTTNSSRVQHRQALHAAIEAAFAPLTTSAVIARLESAGIAWARVNTVNGFIEHPQLTGRDRWREIGSPAGPLRALLPPVRIDGVDPVMGDVPALGQHTDMILGELGVARETIAAWRREGAI